MGLPAIPFYWHYQWRGHYTSPTVVSLKGRLPQKLLSKSTLSCEIVQIHSLFRHGFIKKPKSKFNWNRNRRGLFLCDVFRKTVLGIDLIANAFRGSILNTRLCIILFNYLLFHHLSFRKTEGSLFLLTLRIVWIIHCLYSKDGFTYGHSVQYKMLLVRLHVYRCMKSYSV